MKRHRTHQIDELAQQYFRATIPVTWSYNEQVHDYGKDYLVEPGEEDGEQTGLNFFVQLKGQEAVEFTRDGKQVKFQLETMHAAYYVDKVKDLPVFLVVVDVNRKKGWYHFLQPDLETDRSWRKQKSVTIRLPASNDLAHRTKLLEDIVSAKRMMRLLHPESIQDTIAAHKRRIRTLDPRFDVAVSLVNETPMFELRALEPVSWQVEFRGGKKKAREKVSELLDKGMLVEFKPGEVKITGSPLFEEFEQTGGAMQAALDLPATVTLVYRNAEGRVVGQLTDVPGRIKGGRKELWFDGRLEASPLSARLGPMGRGTSGSMRVNWNLAHWDEQKILHLAYFDKLLDFTRDLADSAAADVQCQVHGTEFFSVTVPQNMGRVPEKLSLYMALIDKARKVAQRFGINPAWTVKTFDADSQQTARDLYALFFEGKLVRKTPNLTAKLTVSKTSFRPEVLKQAKGLVPLSVVSDWGATLLGEKFEIGTVTDEYTAVKLREKKVKSPVKGKQRSKSDLVLEVKGSKDTVRTIRPGDLAGPK
jgi:hypothetical protein